MNVRSLVLRDVIDDPNKEQRDATPFLEAGHSVYHSLVAPFESLRRNDEGLIELVSSNDLPQEFVESLDHDSRASDHVWATPCPMDAKHFQENHHGYQFTKGTKLLLCVIYPTNDRYTTISQFRIENSKGGILGIPKRHCRYVRSSQSLNQTRYSRSPSKIIP